MKEAVSSRLSTTAQHYKRTFDKNVRLEPKFKIREYSFVERPQFASIASDAGDEMANRQFNMLIRLAPASAEYSAFNRIQYLSKKTVHRILSL